MMNLQVSNLSPLFLNKNKKQPKKEQGEGRKLMGGRKKTDRKKPEKKNTQLAAKGHHKRRNS